jgi:hypothetical protein
VFSPQVGVEKITADVESAVADETTAIELFQSQGQDL